MGLRLSQPSLAGDRLAGLGWAWQNSDTIEDEYDDYLSTKHYWASGYLGTVYQTYLDIVIIIDNSDMNEIEKEKENL